MLLVADVLETRRCRISRRTTVAVAHVFAARARIRRRRTVPRRLGAATSCSSNCCRPCRTDHRLLDAADPTNILFEAGLSFLGVEPPQASWGGMLNQADPWFMLVRVWRSSSTALAFNLLGDDLGTPWTRGASDARTDSRSRRGELVMRTSKSTVVLAGAAVAALVVSGCGGGNGGGGSAGKSSSPGITGVVNPSDHKGGTAGTPLSRPCGRRD